MATHKQEMPLIGIVYEAVLNTIENGRTSPDEVVRFMNMYGSANTKIRTTAKDYEDAIDFANRLILTATFLRDELTKCSKGL